MTLTALMVPLAGTALASHDCFLDVTPETATNSVGNDHVLTASISPNPGSSQCNDGQVIEFEIVGAGDTDAGDTPASPDLSCTISGGSCQVTYDSNVTGQDAIRGWCDRDLCSTDNAANSGTPDMSETLGEDGDGDETDVVAKEWVAQGADACALNVTPETDRNNTGTQHTLTATLVETTAGACGASMEIDFEFEAGSANDTDAGTSFTSPDMTCTINDPATSCQVSWTGTNTGTDTVRAWIDNDKDNNTQDLDPAEARDAEATPGDKTEQDDTDVVEKIWANDPATSLDCIPNNPENPSTGTGSTENFLCTVRDAQGTAKPGVNVDAENLAGV
ncbi:MAG TPA: hypothetical protein VFS18_04685, partial [Actinomycetota bacterium]|nr:hypothetical protein [Actinomycetota bacterium]